MQEVAWGFWEIICLFGPMKIVGSDRGSEFVKKLVAALSETWGIDHRLISSYNPRANSPAERLVKTVKGVFQL